MKLIVNKTPNGKKIVKLFLTINELTGEKKVFKGWLNTVSSPSSNDSYEVCELTLDRSVDAFGNYIKPLENDKKDSKE